MEENEKPAGKDDEVYHFISFLPFKNQLYELDGLQAGPISYGECCDETWLALAKEQIQLRMQKYEGSEIRFNLLAIVGDKVDALEKDLSKQKSLEQWIAKKRAGELAENVATGTGELGEFAAVADEIKKMSALSAGDLAAYET
jgi:ubiquitin carboxyl-terminal hydrolase L5